MTYVTVKPNSGRFSVPNITSFVESFFENELPSTLTREWVGQRPLVNIKDTAENYLIEIAAPGFSKEHFSISVEENILTIKGEQKSEKEEENARFTRREFNYTGFTRSFTLPKNVEAEKVTANYENGILTVALPKPEEAKPKGTIEIKVL